MAERVVRLPMFPLGTVLVPSMMLPLHVFEHRYRRLVRDCLATEPEFGVVLISRGSEVGGGEVRTCVGTVARMVEAAEMPDGRFALVTVGSRRVRVERWLDDAPYPSAEVVDWPDADGEAEGEAARALEARRGATVALLRRALALRAEMGDGGPPATVELSEEPVMASHQAAALAPIGPHDRQRLLETPGAMARLALLGELLTEAIEVLEARLAEDRGHPGGQAPPDLG